MKEIDSFFTRYYSCLYNSNFKYKSNLVVLDLREGWRRYPRSGTERYSREPDPAIMERRQGHAIKKRLKVISAVWVCWVFGDYPKNAFSSS